MWVFCRLTVSPDCGCDEERVDEIVGELTVEYRCVSVTIRVESGVEQLGRSGCETGTRENQFLKIERL